MHRKTIKRIALGFMALAAIPGGLVYRRYRADMAAAYRRVAGGGRTLATACGPMRFAELGRGAPVLMVHGAGGGYDQGEYFARLIGGDFRWIAPSRFGFPGAPVPAVADPGSVDSELQAGAYACLLDALGIERVGVVGVSMGGPSALLFARRYPERVRSLALISAAAHAIPPRPAALAATFNLFLNDFVFWGMVRAAPQALLAALGVPPDVQRRLSPAETQRAHAFLASIMPMGARRSGQLLEQRMSEFDAEQIGGIRAPALIVHARDDTLAPFEHGRFAAARIPGARLIPVESGGHLALMFEQNAGALEMVREFLGRGE
jgi:pimeloyl-ACP methyl ester carboxylesterase